MPLVSNWASGSCEDNENYLNFKCLASEAKVFYWFNAAPH
jgi:hypothetical protein